MKNVNIKKVVSVLMSIAVCISAFAYSHKKENNVSLQNSEINPNLFLNPPHVSKPGVYWYFMDGWMSKEGMEKDLDAMKAAGIESVLFLEVNLGIPRGNIEYFSPEWQEMFIHAVRYAEKLGIDITLGVGPGWTGSGGPWVDAKESMRMLEYTTTDVTSNSYTQKIELPKPAVRKPYFGEGVYTPDLKNKAEEYYEDVMVLAYPTPVGKAQINDIENKANYKRDPFSSMPGVKPFYPIEGNAFPEDIYSTIAPSKIINLTSLLQPDGTIEWNIPTGNWTILRMGLRNGGAVTRPAPFPGLGFECDKFSREAFKSHFDNSIGKLIKEVPTTKDKQGGLKFLHMDSWEMGTQNWGTDFQQEFKKLRGYDLTKYLPIYTGQIVENRQISERFLWDIRMTTQELIIKNHAEYIKELAHQHNLGLSIEPYDMSPSADLDLGAVADIPMCEFWAKGIGYNTTYSAIEATSIAHIQGKPIVSSEAFTANWGADGYTQYPTVMKDQTDWAFAAGINKFYYHTFIHQPLDDKIRPGMTMAGYGVHWDRGQTWWDMATDYHTYISRCSYILQQGVTVADILYLSQQGAPCNFLPPISAIEGHPELPDRKGYNFDGCSPDMLIKLATVKDNKIVFPGGASYSVLVLPNSQFMTPELLEKIEQLTKTGAMIIGNAPSFSPSLTNYPKCDERINKIATKMWGTTFLNTDIHKIKYGKGIIVCGKSIYPTKEGEIYPTYDLVKDCLAELNIKPDFVCDSQVRYTHKQTSDKDIYFIANRINSKLSTKCLFRATANQVELWNAVTGERFALIGFKENEGLTELSIDFEPFQSYFIVFNRKDEKENLPQFSFTKPLNTINYQLNTPWQVSFDPQWGGPEKIQFNTLRDWTTFENEGIKYYSGTAIYRNTFTLPDIDSMDKDYYINLGEVKDMARVILNGKDLGVLWTAPWQLKINDCLKQGENQLEIEVVNLWTNRLIGDEHKSDDGIVDGKWPEWIVGNAERTSGRYTFATHKYYTKDSPLSPSGLLGPVQIVSKERIFK